MDPQVLRCQGYSKPVDLWSTGVVNYMLGGGG